MKTLMASYKRRKDESSETDSSINSSAGSDYSLYKRKRVPKSSSRSALMARKNRLKNKMYVASLESDLFRERNKNVKVNNMLKEQTMVIEKQDRELKYLKGIIANSTDIMKLLRNIHDGTGLQVGTSLNKSCNLDESSSLGDLGHDLSDLSPFLPNYDLDLPLNILEDEVRNEASQKTLSEHNYTLSSDCESDLGVCLHVSNHKVALEFCSTCNDNANRLWSNK